MSDTIATIPIRFKWLSCEADPRPYKPGKPIFEPCGYIVEVKLPIENTYIANVEDILLAQVSNRVVPTPILTPLGMKYCVSELENAMSPHPLVDSAEDGFWSNGGGDITANDDAWNNN